jgi:hypothetical protein
MPLLAFTSVHTRPGLTEDRVALCGQSTHEPIGLDRILEPGLGPAVGYTGLNGAGRHFPAVGVEQRQLASGLRQTTLQISALRLRRPPCGCRPLVPIALWVLIHRQRRSDNPPIAFRQIRKEGRALRDVFTLCPPVTASSHKSPVRSACGGFRWCRRRSRRAWHRAAGGQPEIR